MEPADLLITIEVPSTEEEAVLGVLSVAGLDEVVIEDGPGAHTTRVMVYWAPEAGPPPAIDLTSVPSAHRRPDQLVKRSTWTTDWTPHAVGPFWIAPVAPGAEPTPSPKDRLAIYLEAGRGFGFADHPSTRLALLAIAQLPRPIGPSVLDVGSGTGVLALAAHHLGASTVWATDIDPQARAATAANAAINQRPTQVIAAWPPEPADLVLANITPPVLFELAPALKNQCRAGGRMVLSGMVDSDAPTLVARYRPWTVVAEHRCASWPGWVALTLADR